MDYTNFALIKDLFQFIKPHKKKFFIGTFLRLTGDLVWLFPIWAFSEIINFATGYQPGDSLRFFWILMGLILLAGFYHFPAMDGAKYHLYQVAEKVGIEARLQTMSHLFKLDAVWHEKENSGNKIRRMHHGGDGLMQIIRLYVDLFIESTVNLIAISVIFFQLKWQLAGVLLFFFLTYFLLSLYLTKKAKNQAYLANIEWEKVEGVTFEGVNNISTIKALGLSDSIVKNIEKSTRFLMEEIRKRIFRYRTRGAALNIYQEIFRQLIILYTVWSVFQGELEVGSIALVLLYFNKIRESAGEFAEISNEWALAKVAVIRMKDILNEPPTIELSGNKAFPKNWKKIIINDLKFAYKGNQVLKGINLTINRGEKIGIVGLSGAGKSTLFKLLLKLYSGYEGEIRFDKISLKNIKRPGYIRKIAVVPQDTELFNFSLKENITFKDKLSKKEQRQFEQALKIAHVKDFMHKLPLGFDTKIGEKGIKLSGGEKQRVGIARAVYREPDILFMDEATSHLDVESEQKIQDTLHQFFRKTTAIVIAHRLSTIKEMDRIVIIKKGKVTEKGSFDELMKLKGEFYRLWKKQKF